MPTLSNMYLYVGVSSFTVSSQCAGLQISNLEYAPTRTTSLWRLSCLHCSSGKTIRPCLSPVICCARDENWRRNLRRSDGCRLSSFSTFSARRLNSEGGITIKNPPSGFGIAKNSSISPLRHRDGIVTRFFASIACRNSPVKMGWSYSGDSIGNPWSLEPLHSTMPHFYPPKAKNVNEIPLKFTLFSWPPQPQGNPMAYVSARPPSLEINFAIANSNDVIAGRSPGVGGRPLRRCREWVSICGPQRLRGTASPRLHRSSLPPPLGHCCPILYVRVWPVPSTRYL
jgi:hypothetical protein